MPLGTEEIEVRASSSQLWKSCSMGKTSERRKYLGPCPGDMLIQLCKLKHTMVLSRKWDRTEPVLKNWSCCLSIWHPGQLFCVKRSNIISAYTCYFKRPSDIPCFLSTCLELLVVFEDAQGQITMIVCSLDIILLRYIDFILYFITLK